MPDEPDDHAPGNEKRNRVIGWSVLAVAGIAIVVAVVDHTRAGNEAEQNTDRVPAAVTYTDLPSTPAPALPAVTSAPAPDTSSAPPAPPAQPAVVVSDLTEWDQQGDPSCQMHYSQLPDGMTITRFTLTEPGELVTHISDTAGHVHSNDQQESAGAAAFTYDVPLGQISDMGAVFYPNDGQSVTCGITPGAAAP